MNKPKDAVDIYNDIYLKEPSSFKDYSNYGLALYRISDYDNAEQILNKAIEKDKNDYVAMANLAYVYMAQHKEKEAIDEFSKVLALNPDMNSIRFDYANLLADNDNIDEAILQYEEYLKTSKNNEVAYLNTGILYSRKEDYPKAIEILKQGKSVAPKNIEIQKELAKAYHLNKNYNEAILEYDSLLASTPEDTDILLNKAVAYHALKKYTEAIDIYKSLLEKKSGDKKISEYLYKAYIAQADNLFNEGNYRKAVQNYELALNINPDDPILYINIANTYDKMGSKSKVIEYYEKAMEAAPDNPDVLSSYAKTLNKYDKTDEAKLVYEKALFVQDTKVEDKYDYYIDIADTYYKNKDYTNALENYLKAETLNKNDEYLYIKLGNTYKGLSKLDEAVDSYKKSIEVNNQNPDAFFNIGLCRAELNDLTSAKENFSKVIELKPGYAYAYYAMGLAFEKENNLEKAVEYYETFVEITEDKNLRNNVQNKINNLKKKLNK